MKMSRILVDVDGVVADLMAGFQRYFLETHGIEIGLPSTHRFKSAPEYAFLAARFDMDVELTNYLSVPDVYQNYIPEIPQAVPGINELRSAGHEIGFVTATWKGSPTMFGSKLKWLEERFPGIPMLSVDSLYKNWVTGDYCIEDRFDACYAWHSVGVKPFLFNQPWNEAPSWYKRYNWSMIVDELT